jgi:hypothetical protein
LLSAEGEPLILSSYSEYDFCSVAVKPLKIEDMGKILHEAINGHS